MGIIEELEAAKEASDALDEAIYIALGAKPPTDDRPLYWTSPDGLRQHFSALIPGYTRSIDAAMTLVPANVHWLIQNLGVGFEAAIYVGSTQILVKAATAQIALCAAALKASDA